jgi:hypothetical protein
MILRAVLVVIAVFLFFYFWRLIRGARRQG